MILLALIIIIITLTLSLILTVTLTCNITVVLTLITTATLTRSRTLNRITTLTFIVVSFRGGSEPPFVVSSMRRGGRLEFDIGRRFFFAQPRSFVVPMA